MIVLHFSKSLRKIKFEIYTRIIMGKYPTRSLMKCLDSVFNISHFTEVIEKLAADLRSMTGFKYHHEQNRSSGFIEPLKHRLKYFRETRFYLEL